ncbi:MAG: nitrite reductase small subunit NirD [Burkholderiaceae bacterium]
MNWVKLLPLQEIPRRGARCVNTPNGKLALFRTMDDQVFAIEDRCPHKGGPLSQGIVHGDAVTCPLHNYVISLSTGAVLGADEGSVATYELRVNDAMVELAWPPEVSTQPAAVQ